MCQGTALISAVSLQPQMMRFPDEDIISAHQEEQKHKNSIEIRNCCTLFVQMTNRAGKDWIFLAIDNKIDQDESSAATRWGKSTTKKMRSDNFVLAETLLPSGANTGTTDSIHSTWQVHACSPQVTNVTQEVRILPPWDKLGFSASPWDIHQVFSLCNALWSCFVMSQNTPDQLGDHTNKGFFPPCDLVKCTEWQNMDKINRCKRSLTVQENVTAQLFVQPKHWSYWTWKKRKQTKNGDAHDGEVMEVRSNLFRVGWREQEII